jgi:hypothetical protein
MVKAKANGKESAKKASKPGKKEPKRLDKTDESTDIPAIPSTSEWKGRKIAKVCAHLIQSRDVFAGATGAVRLRSHLNFQIP